MSIPEPWLRGIQEWAQRNDIVQEVWLFGSQARGDAREDSDIDLAIVIPSPAGRTDGDLWKYFAHGDSWQTDLAAIVGRRVSLQAMRPNTEKYAEIRGDGILLWRRDGN
jgi:predicted nucleotidyltransferase